MYQLWNRPEQRSEIWVAQTDGSGQRLLVQGADVAHPWGFYMNLLTSWQPDGKHISFFQEYHGEWWLWSLNPPTGKRQKLALGVGHLWLDADRLLLMRSEHPEGLWIKSLRGSPALKLNLDWEGKIVRMNPDSAER
jgi:hypothetical protein